ncbi:MAG: hypothetical protein NZ936_06975, partial [Alphaproteobacteria bacterium]|nr:hypothetical protein [Alphaproteobacteria bacterium]
YLFQKFPIVKYSSRVSIDSRIVRPYIPGTRMDRVLTKFEKQSNTLGLTEILEVSDANQTIA